jgi:H/ACA ribonucleoprotein complex subunit 4
MEDLKKDLEFGFIVIDKPVGPTSFIVSDFIKKSMGLNKVSHLGTLDPHVSGVLPIALGRACKLAGQFLGKNKQYIGIIRTHKEISLEELQDKIDKKFIGKIKQMPPKKSNVKRQIREREILSFKLLEKDGKDILFLTEVQGGTYIRKLCSDIGELIGGAHMLELRRIGAGIFKEADAINLYDFEQAINEFNNGNNLPLSNMVLSADSILEKIFEKIKIVNKNIKDILNGRPLFKKDLLAPPNNDTFILFSEDKFLGLYSKVNEEEIVARPLFVLN